MDENEKIRLRRCMRYSHSGVPISDDDSDFVMDMFKSHRKEYGEIHKQVVEESHKRLNPLYKP